MSGAVRVPTLREVREALGNRRPARRHGQNFLTDAALLKSIVDAAGLSPGDVVLEVGPGPGTLTAELLGRGALVVAVEVDPAMITILGELLGSPAGLTVVAADILENHPALPVPVTEALARQSTATGRDWFVLVANLPYQIAARFLVDLLWDRPPARGVVTVQLEVAERLRAAPGTPAYGPLSVLVQLRSAVRIARQIPPGAFWPRPKVDSACVLLEPTIVDSRVESLPPGFLAEVVRGVFHNRRKSLLNSLAQAFAGRVERGAVRDCLAEKKFEKDRRGEALSPMEIVELALDLQGLVTSGDE